MQKAKDDKLWEWPMSKNNRRKGNICIRCGGSGKSKSEESPGKTCEVCGGKGWTFLNQKIPKG